MSTRNPGLVLQITGGVHVGKYAIAYHKEQNEAFRRLKKLYIHLYEDEEFTIPVNVGDKKIGSLIQQEFCQRIGMVD